MEIVLKYGKTGLKIPFPGSCNITQIEKKPMRLGSIHLYSDQLPAEQHALTGVQQISELSETLRPASSVRRIRVLPSFPMAPMSSPFVTTNPW